MSDNLKAFARKLVGISLDAGGSPDAGRVSAVLAVLAENPPAKYRALLHQYGHYLEAAERAAQVQIEYAGPEPAAVVGQIAESLGRAYHRKLTPRLVPNEALIGGIRVSVGDDVYDASLAAALAKLRRASAA